MTERANQWRVWLARWERSGLSQADFCRRHGLKAVTFSWWKRELGDGRTRRRRRGERGDSAQAAERRPKFVEVAVASPRPSLSEPRTSGYEIVLQSGHIIRLPGEFDAQAVARLIVAVESAGEQATVESAC